MIDSGIEHYEKDIEKLLGYLERAGWGPCNIAACNCNGWHQVRPSRAEIELQNELASARADVARLREALEKITMISVHIGKARDIAREAIATPAAPVDDDGTVEGVSAAAKVIVESGVLDGVIGPTRTDAGKESKP